MATTRDNAAGPEHEETEKPVREQLKKASISKAVDDGSMATSGVKADTEHVGENGDSMDAAESRGRLTKKRSFEDIEAEAPQDRASSEAVRHHTRKRSRDSTAEEVELNNGQRKSGERTRDDAEDSIYSTSNGHPKAPPTERQRTPEQIADKQGETGVEAIASPKTKRSRLHSSTEENGTPAVEKASSEIIATTGTGKVATEEKPATKIPPTSGFANTSASSPFATLSGSKSPSVEPQTAPSAFASSGFSSLTSAGSGFGAIGKVSGGFGAGGGFATGSKSPPFVSEPSAASKENERPKPPSSSMFGGPLGQQSSFAAAGTASGSAFGTGASSFGKIGGSSGFGGSGFSSGGFGGIGGGAGLTSWASGKPSTALASSSKPAKVFGAPADAEEEAQDVGEEEDEAGFKSPLSQESDKQDDRFYAQDLETGEEDEFTEYSCRAKLYNFASVADGKKEWKERGLGVVRLNVRKAAPGEDDTKPTARLLMRAEGSHRVILNTAVKKEIKFGTPTGDAPQGGYVYFMGAVDGKASLELLQLKVSKMSILSLYGN